MTGRELLAFEIERVGRQIDICLEGLPDGAYEIRCAPNGMSPREILEHLADAYEAFLAHGRAEKYRFGAYRAPDQSFSGIKSAYRKQRVRAIEAALATPDDEGLKDAYDYIVGHDNYHVAQLCMARLQAEPDWDLYAIYR